jgi:hypothetical protein
LTLVTLTRQVRIDVKSLTRALPSLVTWQCACVAIALSFSKWFRLLSDRVLVHF